MRSLALNRILTGFFVFIFMLLLVSCAPSGFPQTHKAEDIPADAPVSWFRDDSASFLFNTRIDLFKKHFSGLLVFKNMGGDTFRVVFITEVGLKIMDLEVPPVGEPKVWYIMDAMNKKALVRTLSGDLKLMIMPFASVDPVKCYAVGDDFEKYVYKYKSDKQKCFLLRSSMAQEPIEIRQAGWLSNKVKVNFYGNPEAQLDSIFLKHYKIKLQMNLQRIIQ